LSFWVKSRQVVILASALLAAASPAIAALQDENLLMVMPTGFKVGFQATKGSMDIVEYVPVAETVQSWSEMVTVQIIHSLHGADPDKFANALANQWKAACKGGDATQGKTGTENGYPFALWVFTCPLDPITNKPETMFLKAIGGADSLYSVQYAYGREADTAMPGPTMKYLFNVRVCDTRRTDRACPPGM